jgi:hypothetical protein
MNKLIVLVAVLLTGCAGLPQSLPPAKFSEAVRAGELGGYNLATQPKGETRIYQWGSPTPITIRP